MPPTTKLGSKGMFQTFLDKWRNPKRYKLLEKTESLIVRELDLFKAVSQLRMLSLITLGSLTTPRRALATKMTEFVIASNDSEVSHSATERVSIRQEEVVTAIKTLHKSEDSTDKRFLNLLKIKNARAARREISEEDTPFNFNLFPLTAAHQASVQMKSPS